MEEKYKVRFRMSKKELVNKNIPDGAMHYVDYVWERWYNDSDMMYNDIYQTMEVNKDVYDLFTADVYENNKFIYTMTELGIIRFKDNQYYNTHVIKPSDLDNWFIKEKKIGVFNGDQWGADKSKFHFHFDDKGRLIDDD